MSEVLKSLKIYNFFDLYISSKLSFLESIKKNELSAQIFDCLCLDLNKVQKNSKSFQVDIKLLEKHFNIDIELIYAGPILLRKSLTDKFKEPNGLKDSILHCLSKRNQKFFKNLLDLLLSVDYQE